MLPSCIGSAESSDTGVDCLPVSLTRDDDDIGRSSTLLHEQVLHGALGLTMRAAKYLRGSHAFRTSGRMAQEGEGAHQEIAKQMIVPLSHMQHTRITLRSPVRWSSQSSNASSGMPPSSDGLQSGAPGAACARVNTKHPHEELKATHISP